MLAPTLFNFFFDTVIRLAMGVHHPGAGLSLSYLLDANLVGNRKKLTSEILVSDLEYADDMALICDSYDGLTTLLESLDSKCLHMGLTINCKKTKLLAVLPDADAQPPAPILLHAASDPIEIVPSFQCLGSIVTSDCTSDAEILSRITKASQSFGSLSRILWHQKKIKQNAKLCIFDSVVLSTLLYGLETAVLLYRATDPPSAEFRDALSSLHPWSVFVGRTERHLHQKVHSPSVNLHHADPKASSSSGSHHEDE